MSSLWLSHTTNKEVEEFYFLKFFSYKLFVIKILSKWICYVTSFIATYRYTHFISSFMYSQRHSKSWMIDRCCNKHMSCTIILIFISVFFFSFHFILFYCSIYLIHIKTQWCVQKKKYYKRHQRRRLLLHCIFFSCCLHEYLTRFVHLINLANL